MKKYFFYFALVLLMPFSINVVFAKDKIEPLSGLKTQIEPRRATEPELKAFLLKLNGLKESYELVEFSPANMSEYKNICRDSKTGKLEDCGNSYHTLWIADLNNDGKPDYVWTDEVEGFDHDDYFEVYDDAGDGKIEAVEMPKNPCDFTNLNQKPFRLEDGKTYFYVVTYIAQNKKGQNIASGANSNAAPDAYYSVTIECKCIWRNGKIRVVKRTESKEKYEQ